MKKIFEKWYKKMEDRYLFKGKEKDSGKWLKWNAVAGVPHNVSILTDTICQCTGLKDDNGNLIWENDILFLKDEINGCKWKAVVEFGNPTGEYNWGWQLVQVTECEANKDILLWIETEMSYMNAKIIGNTIDNLELVESEE